MNNRELDARLDIIARAKSPRRQRLDDRIKRDLAAKSGPIGAEGWSFGLASIKATTGDRIQIATRIIKRWEAARGPDLAAYLCPGGVWTIGYGHTGPVAREGATITFERAEELLQADIRGPAEAVSKAERDAGRKLTETQAGALISFVYNVGVGAFEKSTMRRKIVSGDDAGASDEFARWVYADGRRLDGLANRREAERNVFLGREVPPLPTPTEPEPAPTPPTKPIRQSTTVWAGLVALAGTALSFVGDVLGGIAGLAQDSGAMQSIQDIANAAPDGPGHVIIGGLIAWMVLERVRYSREGKI